MDESVAGERIGLGAVSDAGGADCGELGEFATAAGPCLARCQTVADGTGKVLRQAGTPAGTHDSAGVSVANGGTEKMKRQIEATVLDNG